MKAPADGRSYYVMVMINNKQEMAYKDKRGVIFLVDPNAEIPYTYSTRAYKGEYQFVRGCSSFDF